MAVGGAFGGFGPGARTRQSGLAGERRSLRRRRAPGGLRQRGHPSSRRAARGRTHGKHVARSRCSGGPRGSCGVRWTAVQAAAGPTSVGSAGERPRRALRGRPRRETPAGGTGRRGAGLRPDERRRHGRQGVWRRTLHARNHRREVRRRGNPAARLPPPRVSSESARWHRQLSARQADHGRRASARRRGTGTVSADASHDEVVARVGPRVAGVCTISA